MKLENSDAPLVVILLFAVLVVFLILNKLLFYINHSNYSIKYSIMRDSKFFRVHHIMAEIVEIVYKLFFVVPFALLVVISIIRGIADTL